ncbi:MULTISPECIES: tyrosine-type recombinase/integrase [unclassified Streptomyces]|uniref:tyrosine-type recombinase/integrase n=1 Tax=unclassified Streptomyces TaxID=2593676 RepID=UPI000748519F|nr:MULTISPECIES: integrase [unclassified Streptomyces]KUL62448.1 integrase [Streptomyces sp. NRRL S-1521]
MSYNVRFWDIRERPDRRKPFMVRWTVDGREKSESFMTFGLADSRRSKLMTAARDGEAFDVHTGLPASELRAIKQRTTWYDLAHEYLDQRWDRTPGNTRRTLADAFATITPALVRPGVTYPEPRVLRRALYSWAFNKNAWAQEPQEEWRKALDWMKRNSLPIGVLAEADVLRRGLDALCRKLDGTAAAAKTARRKRAAFSEVLNTAVERGYFAENPLNGLRWKAPAVNEEVNPAAVPNPAQVARLLAAVAQQRGRGPHLEAFYGCMYYAAMRPAEVIHLRLEQCHLPESGWGLLNLSGGVVTAGKDWTDDGAVHEVHALKRRATTAIRPVPIPPQFVGILREHIERFGVAPDGRLFRNQAGNYVDAAAYGVTWARARKYVLTRTELASGLAKRPYDLRHAGISFWLYSGVDPAECARRAGQSIEVLFRHYAKFLDGVREQANRLIEQSMKEWDHVSQGTVPGP